MSSTVTVAVQVDVFPFSSVAVSVTTVDVMSLQSNVFGVTFSVIPLPMELQLSVVPLSMSAATMAASPFASRTTVIS